jgi:threonine dehydratase
VGRLYGRNEGTHTGVLVTANPGPAPRISVQTIAEALPRIRPDFLDSPQIENPELSRAIGTPLICKIETRNPVGSFKGRGTDFFVNALPANVRTLVTASAGNFGLALVHSGNQRGIRVTVYAAATASQAKLERIRSIGGTVKIEALTDLAGVVDDVVLVGDDAIKRAMRLIHQHLDVIAEPAATTGVAALLTHSALAQGLVCTPITGGNATLEQLRAWTTQIQ